VVERVGLIPGRIAGYGGRQQLDHLPPQLLLDRLEEPGLGDLAGPLLDGPVVEAHDHDRQVGQFDDGPDAVSEQQLAGTDLADLALVRGGGVHSSSSSPASVSSLTAVTN